MIYALGDQEDNILTSYKLFSSQMKQYHTVKTKFDVDILIRRNVFFPASKDQDDLRSNFGRPQDSKSSQKLQRDPELSLTKKRLIRPDKAKS